MVENGTDISSRSLGRLLLKGGTIYDGSGEGSVRMDLLIDGGIISVVGEDLDARGAKVVDVSGMAVTPGFIDVHNHTHEKGDAPDDEESCKVFSQVGQGITTAVVGMDGFGEVDIAKYARKIRSAPRSINICRLVGHSYTRYKVLGREVRPATDEETQAMAGIVEQAMKDGAWGLSSGLEGRRVTYASTEELIACAKAAAPYGGYYETHLRSEEGGVFEAAEEAVRICREAGGIPLSISHIKVSMVEALGRADELLEIMQAARAEGITVYANWRPSSSWPSNLKVLDRGAKGDPQALAEEISHYWPKAQAYCHKCASHPEIVGRTLRELAEEWSITPAEALLEIWDTMPDAAFEFEAQTWQDKRTLLEDPCVMVASDGWEADKRIDPLSWSAFPIFFGTIVREWGYLGLAEAVRRCTSLPAEMLGLADRGRLAPRFKADVVVFDPETIRGERHWDKADTQPEGIAYVIVNGRIVMDHGRHTGERPGEFLAKSRA